MTHERIIAYLLEELSEREAEQFEEECLALPEWPSDDLESAEHDLIEAYIHNELSPDRHRRFEDKYLITAARKDDVLLARSFARVVESADPPKVTWIDRFCEFCRDQRVRPKFATAAIILFLGVGLLLWSIAPPTFANLELTIISEDRSQDASTAQIEKVTLPLGKDALRISLILPEPTPEGATYSVQWETAKGPLKTLAIESQDDKSIKVVIPAEDLVPARYALKLLRKNRDGTEQRVNGSYFFDVE